MSPPTTEALLDTVEVPENKEEHSTNGAVGVPCQVHRLSWMDLGASAVVLLSFIVAMVAVLNQTTAVSLGQTNQLVLLGLMLSIMAISTQRQIQILSLLYEARLGKSTLQNFDAILRNAYFSPAVSLGPRASLLFVLALPLALSASYKQFIGGSTKLEVPVTPMQFGATAAPGYQLIGDGLSLLVNVYLPFWTTRVLGRTYGFNMYVADNTTAAILDAPRPADLTRLQASLHDDQSITISAQVNATVTENVNPSQSERNDSAYWADVENLYNILGPSTDVGINHAYQDMWAGQGQNQNNWTEIYLARWNTTENQTFYSEAERFVTIRRTCVGTWNITRQNASLVDVTNLQAADAFMASETQNVIQNNTLSIGYMFSRFLGEYDWTTRKTWDQPLPGTSSTDPKFSPVVNTRPALIAAMLWARIVSLDGPERPSSAAYLGLAYEKAPDKITAVKEVVTLRRSPWLIVVLAINPVITILAVMVKALLYATPIGDGFSMISMLAGIREDGRELLRGAALSGKLTEDVRIRFTARDEGEDLGYDRLNLGLGSQAQSDTLDLGKLYG